MAAWNEASAGGGFDECAALVRSAEALRFSAPELAVQLARRALAVGAESTDAAAVAEAKVLSMRAQAILTAGLVRMSHAVDAVEPAFAALALADGAEAVDVAMAVRLDLAACTREVGEPLLGCALLRPVLMTAQPSASVRAAALGRLVGCVAHVGRRDDIEDALAEADRLLASDDGLSPDVRRLERARLSVRAAAYHRWYGDTEDAADAAREGLTQLNRLHGLRAETARLRAQLVLELACALLDEGALDEAVSVSEAVLAEPVRATSAAAVGRLMLAMSTRVHLPAGRTDRGRGLLDQAVWVADRHSLDGLLADVLTAVSQLDEKAGRTMEALESLRAARAAEQRRRRSVSQAVRHLLIGVSPASWDAESVNSLLRSVLRATAPQPTQDWRVAAQRVAQSARQRAQAARPQGPQSAEPPSELAGQPPRTGREQQWPSEQPAGAQPTQALRRPTEQPAPTVTGEQPTTAHPGKQVEAARPGEQPTARWSERPAPTQSGEYAGTTQRGDRSAAAHRDEPHATTWSGEPPVATQPDQRPAVARAGEGSAAARSGEQPDGESAAARLGERPAVARSSGESAAAPPGEQPATRPSEGAAPTNAGEPALAAGWGAARQGEPHTTAPSGEHSVAGQSGRDLTAAALSSEQPAAALSGEGRAAEQALGARQGDQPAVARGSAPHAAPAPGDQSAAAPSRERPTSSRSSWQYAVQSGEPLLVRSRRERLAAARSDEPSSAGTAADQPAEPQQPQIDRDEATGLLNKEGLIRRLRAVRNGERPVALTLVRLGSDSGSRRFADPGTRPAAAADFELSELAGRVRNIAPDNAELARSDGTELAVLLPHTTRDQAEKFAAAIEAAWLGTANGHSISTGVVQSNPDAPTVDARALINAARHALTPAVAAPRPLRSVPNTVDELDELGDLEDTGDTLRIGRAIISSLSIPAGSGGKRRAPDATASSAHSPAAADTDAKTPASGEPFGPEAAPESSRTNAPDPDSALGLPALGEIVGATGTEHGRTGLPVTGGSSALGSPDTRAPGGFNPDPAPGHRRASTQEPSGTESAPGYGRAGALEPSDSGVAPGHGQATTPDQLGTQPAPGDGRAGASELAGTGGGTTHGSASTPEAPGTDPAASGHGQTGAPEPAGDASAPGHGRAGASEPAGADPSSHGRAGATPSHDPAAAVRDSLADPAGTAGTLDNSSTYERTRAELAELMSALTGATAPPESDTPADTPADTLALPAPARPTEDHVRNGSALPRQSIPTPPEPDEIPEPERRPDIPDPGDPEPIPPDPGQQPPDEPGPLIPPGSTGGTGSTGSRRRATTSENRTDKPSQSRRERSSTTIAGLLAEALAAYQETEDEPDPAPAPRPERQRDDFDRLFDWRYQSPASGRHRSPD